MTPKLQRKAAHGVHGNRGTVWPEPWRRLAEAYGGNVVTPQNETTVQPNPESPG